MTDGDNMALLGLIETLQEQVHALSEQLLALKQEEDARWQAYADSQQAAIDTQQNFLTAIKENGRRTDQLHGRIVSMANAQHTLGDAVTELDQRVLVHSQVIHMNGLKTPGGAER